MFGMYSGLGARTTSASVGAPALAGPDAQEITPRPPRRVCVLHEDLDALEVAARLIAQGAAMGARAARTCAAIVFETDCTRTYLRP